MVLDWACATRSLCPILRAPPSYMLRLATSRASEPQKQTGGGGPARPCRQAALTLSHKFGEHAVGVNGDKQRPSTGQHFAFLVQNLARIHVLSSAHAQLT